MSWKFTKTITLPIRLRTELYIQLIRDRAIHRKWANNIVLFTGDWLTIYELLLNNLSLRLVCRAQCNELMIDLSCKLSGIWVDNKKSLKSNQRLKVKAILKNISKQLMMTAISWENVLVFADVLTCLLDFTILCLFQTKLCILCIVLIPTSS